MLILNDISCQSRLAQLVELTVSNKYKEGGPSSSPNDVNLLP